MESGFTESKLAVTSIQATLLFPSRHPHPAPTLPPSPLLGVYSDTGKLAEVWEKWCWSLRPGGGEVFKMTFPQLMPDTFSRGKKKCKWAQPGGQAGVFERPAGRGLGFNQGHPATAIRASHTHTHTRLYYTTLPWHPVHWDPLQLDYPQYSMWQIHNSCEMEQPVFT